MWCWYFFYYDFLTGYNNDHRFFVVLFNGAENRYNYEMDILKYMDDVKLTI